MRPKPINPLVILNFRAELTFKSRLSACAAEAGVSDSEFMRAAVEQAVEAFELRRGLLRVRIRWLRP